MLLKRPVTLNRRWRWNRRVFPGSADIYCLDLTDWLVESLSVSDVLLTERSWLNTDTSSSAGSFRRPDPRHLWEPLTLGKHPEMNALTYLQRVFKYYSCYLRSINTPPPCACDVCVQIKTLSEFAGLNVAHDVYGFVCSQRCLLDEANVFCRDEPSSECLFAAECALQDQLPWRSD